MADLRRALRPSPAMLNRATRLGPVARGFGRFQARVFRMTRGRLMKRWVGVPILVLETVGRKSGKRRETALLHLRDGDDFVVVAANAGTDRTPAWFLNLTAAGDAAVIVDGGRSKVRPEVVTGAEKEALWPRLVATYGGLEEYRTYTAREFPVVRLRRLGRG